MKPQLHLKTLLFATLFVASIFCPTAAQALPIVDTGSSSTSGTAGNVLSSSERRTSFSGKSASAWLSAEFNLGQGYTITDVEGWISLRRPAYPPTGDAWGNTFRIAIYGDGGETPNVSNVLLSQEFTIDKSTVNTAGWRGLHGLNLDLAAGTYWVAFEVPAFVGGVANNTWGVMPTNNPAVPNPLGNEAYLSSSQGNVWIASDNTNIGVRISAPVPEPAEWTMLIAGLLVIGFIARRRREFRFE